MWRPPIWRYYKVVGVDVDTSYLKELSPLAPVAMDRVLEGLPQRGALHLDQVEGSPEGQHQEQVLHCDGS